MTRLFLVESDSLNVYYNQAIEKYLLDHTGTDEVILYLWRNDHTIVIGRNQDAASECNLERFEKDGGHLARRISGGGAVYHDAGNLNFTFLTKRDLFDIAVQDHVILDALNSLGIRATKNGRNDLEIEGRKFSGHAYFKGKENCLHHGTLMLEVNEELLSKYLNVSLVKLHSKSVSSVRSRIINLKSVKEDLEIDDLRRGLFNSAAIGYVITRNGSVSGAEAGCQAEVGSASAMAAAALVFLKGGNAEQVCNAAGFALQNLLGLVCDPVAGLVEVPCVKRNVMGVMNALSCADMALAGLAAHIPADEIVDAMKTVGRMLPTDLRETGRGGLAATPWGREFSRSFFL